MTSFSRWLSLLLVLLTASVGLAQPSPAPAPKPLTVYFFDVGQGDAALVVSPTGKTVLIDGGPPEAGERLASRLSQLVHAPLDLVILTHPHLDHLGSMKDAIRAVGAKRFMDPGFDHPSAAYRDLLDFVGDEVGQVMTPQPNPQAPESFLTIGLGEGVVLTIYWPRHPKEPFLKNTRSDPNSNSIVAKLSYGKTSFLFTGDAEPDTEAALLRQKADYSATVLKVAHHGGKHSSTEPFLAAVRPKAAVISCGAGNDYGHPTQEALERLGAVQARVFRTDQNGEIQAVSNGSTVTLQAARGGTPPLVITGEVKPVVNVPSAPPAPAATGREAVPVAWKAPAPTPATPSPSPSALRFVSLKGSEVFHREDCSTLKRAKTKERKVYTSRSDAARERRAAEDCHP
ncbi:ComEC/Rec2 family competence protein [Hyalangium rubrum]|uniref:ComEC/Rec2 family competence protein n=1 Tax=Hyalangium rubrum TaxID=3103134 RepID=A0ABU5H4Y2_9BACT|nr:ComEC/Rec2 family competence protein [Hyalangium sp. s54d21]MDY7228529.1 ComEC/Rec2 family competence protein [Hyalangium sp. s54d21]